MGYIQNRTDLIDEMQAVFKYVNDYHIKEDAIFFIFTNIQLKKFIEFLRYEIFLHLFVNFYF